MMTNRLAATDDVAADRASVDFCVSPTRGERPPEFWLGFCAGQAATVRTRATTAAGGGAFLGGRVTRGVTTRYARRPADGTASLRGRPQTGDGSGAGHLARTAPPSIIDSVDDPPLPAAVHAPCESNMRVWFNNVVSSV